MKCFFLNYRWRDILMRVIGSEVSVELLANVPTISWLLHMPGSEHMLQMLR